MLTLLSLDVDVDTEVRLYLIQDTMCWTGRFTVCPLYFLSLSLTHTYIYIRTSTHTQEGKKGKQRKETNELLHYLLINERSGRRA